MGFIPSVCLILVMTIKISNIDDVISKVEKLATPDPPSIHRFTGMDGYFTSMRRALEIVREYQNRDISWDPNKIESDMVVLSAIHAEMSEMVGYLQGLSSRFEHMRKITEAKYAVSIKTVRDKMIANQEPVKINEDDVRYGSRILAEDDTDAARDAEIVSRIITNAWYAISSHIEVLRSALRRATAEYRSS